MAAGINESQQVKIAFTLYIPGDGRSTTSCFGHWNLRGFKDLLKCCREVIVIKSPEGEQTLVMADGCETGDGAGDWKLEPGGDEEEEDEACSSSSMNETRQRERMQLRGAQQDGGASVCVIRW